MPRPARDMQKLTASRTLPLPWTGVKFRLTKAALKRATYYSNSGRCKQGSPHLVAACAVPGPWCLAAAAWNSVAAILHKENLQNEAPNVFVSGFSHPPTVRHRTRLRTSARHQLFSGILESKILHD